MQPVHSETAGVEMEGRVCRVVTAGSFGLVARGRRVWVAA
jgi:hypothetical protein